VSAKKVNLSESATDPHAIAAPKDVRAPLLGPATKLGGMLLGVGSIGGISKVFGSAEAPDAASRMLIALYAQVQSQLLQIDMRACNCWPTTTVQYMSR